MKNLYKWQGITIWIIGILTFISISGRDFSGQFIFLGYLLDLIFGIGLNILVLWLLFMAGNWVYRKMKK